MAVFSSPLSQENRIQIARSSFSSSSIVGGGSLSISPVVSAPPPQQDPETLKLLEDNQSGLVDIFNSINGVRQSIDGLNQSLNNLLATYSINISTEFNRENQKAQQERTLAEDALRDENEAILERKIQNSATSAVQPIAQQTQQSLNSLMGVFNPLFLGWLGFGAIQNVQSLLGNSKEKFTNIGDAVENSFKFIVSGLDSVKSGLLDIISKVTSMTNDVVSVVTKGLFKGLFGGMIDNKGSSAGTEGAAKGTAAAAEDAAKGTAAAAEDAAKGTAAAAEDALKGLKGVGKNVLRGASGLMSAAFGMQEYGERKEQGQTTTQAAAGAGGSVAGAEVGALTGARVGSLLGPIGAISGAIGGGALGWMGGGNLADMFTGAKKEKPTPTQTSQKKIQPKPSLISAPTPPPQPPNAEPPKITAKETLTAPSPLPDTQSQSTENQPQSVSIESPASQFDSLSPNVEPQTPIISPLKIQQESEKISESSSSVKADFQVNFGDQISNYTTKMNESTSINNMEDANQEDMKSSFGNNLIKNSAMSFTPFDFTPKEENEINYSVPATMSPIKKNVSVSETVGPLPEPPPNIVVAPLASQQKTKVSPPGSRGIANDVPNISSSNSDNFYVSYSLTQYNVVI